MPSCLGTPRELEIVLNGPIGPQRLHDDTVVVDEGGWYRTITPSSSWPGANEILFSNLNMRDPEGEIDAIIGEYHGLGLPLTWCVYPWTQPSDLGNRLLARGATQSVVLGVLGSASFPLELVRGVEVTRVDPRSEEEYESYIGLMSAGFNLPPDEVVFRRRRYRQLIDGPDPCMHLLLARYNREVAGCCAMVVKEDSAHMTGVYVKPEFQARGVFPSLRAAALKYLRGIGIDLVTGHANEKSAVWVERFGSKVIYSYRIYQLSPPSVP